MAHLFNGLDRDHGALNGWMRLAHYPVGIAGASIGTWVSQNTPSLYNKVFVIGIFFSGIAVVMYHAVRRFLSARQTTEM